MKRRHDDIFVEGGILAEEARQGVEPDYSYTSNGLPELRTETVRGWSPFTGKHSEPAQKQTEQKPACK